VRIQLRAWRTEDVEDLVRIVQDSMIARYTRVPSPYGRADAEVFIAGSVLSRRTMSLAVVAGDVLVGAVSVRRDLEFGEVGRNGYFTAASARRQGVASVAVAALAEETLTRGLFSKIEAWVDTSNLPSIGLVRSLGFTHEGTLTRRARHAGKFTDMAVLAVTTPAEIRQPQAAGQVKVALRTLLDKYFGSTQRPSGLTR
jgi:RimJ/RimL family protein N-acetyltransferase